MALTSWINKIIYRKGAEGQEIDEVFPIGTTFDKVYYSEREWFSLKDVVDNLKKFFSRQGFMLYSTNTPTIYSKTMEWYALGGDTINVDPNLVVTDPNEEVYNN